MAADTSTEYPVAFYFSLSFGQGENKAEGAFKEASGISVTLGKEEVACGGENRFKYKLPDVPTYTNLELKRGLLAKGSKVTKWCEKTLNGGLVKPIEPADVNLKLLNAKGQPVATWSFYQAYPVKWAISNFDSMKNELLIESLEFAYQYFTRQT